VGDLAERESFHVVEPERGGLLVGQDTGGGFPQAVAAVLIGDELGGAGGGGLDFVERVLAGDRPTASPGIDAHAASDGEEPGAESPPSIVPKEMADHAEERFLEEVLGIITTAPVSQEVQHRGLVTTEQFLEAGVAAALRLIGQFLVG
jgi:hypothetical protein